MPNRRFTSDDAATLKRLRCLWDTHKSALGLTQAKAAKALGLTQATVAQYLNGHIALNTDTVLGFARLLGVAPGAIDPSLNDLGPPPKVRTYKIPVLSTLSGAPARRNPDGSYATVMLVDRSHER